MSHKKDKRKAKGAEGPDLEFKESADAVAGDSSRAVEAADEQPVDEVGLLRQEIEQWKDKFLRAKAEQQNAARRAANEIEESSRYANAGVLRALLEVVDDFDRVVEASARSESVSAVCEGVQLVQQKLHKFLADQGIEVIAAENARFDPSRHEALMQQASETHEPGQVVKQVQKGYALRDRVLRPAKVIVAAAPAAKQGDEQGGTGESGEGK